jgi:hypothetical protein
MTNVKVFADRQTDWRTSQKLYAPNLSIRGHKNGQRLKNILFLFGCNIICKHFNFNCIKTIWKTTLKSSVSKLVFILYTWYDFEHT